MKYILVLCLGLLYTSCKQKNIIIEDPKLIVGIEVQQEFYSVFILNKIQNAVRYDLDYGDGTKLIGDTTLNNKTIGINGGDKYYYKQDGTYTIVLTAYDKNGVSKTVSVQIVVDYIKKNTPVADFSLKFLDNGIVQMTNLSKSYNSLDIGVSVGNWGYKTKVENPTFMFDMNGKYRISLAASNEFYNQKNAEFEVKNLVNRELGYFKGEWFGKTVDVKEDFNNQSITYYYDIGSGNTYLLLKQIFLIDNSKGIELTNFKVKTDSLKTNQMKYEQIKSKFKVGTQNSEDWAINVLGIPISKSIEIIEVREVPQPKLIPEMYNKAFWVTFKIKADFGNGNNIDGTLKVRYLIY